LDAHLPAAWASDPSIEHELGERAKSKAQSNSSALDKSIELKQRRHDDHGVAVKQKKPIGQGSSDSKSQLLKSSQTPAPELVNGTAGVETVRIAPPTSKSHGAAEGHFIWASEIQGKVNLTKDTASAAKDARKMEQVPAEGKVQHVHAEAKQAPTEVKQIPVQVKRAPVEVQQAAPRSTQLVVVAPPPAVPALPSLFCYAYVIKDSIEPWLLRVHLAKGAGVFGCGSYTVFSDESLDLGHEGVAAPFIVPLPGKPAWRGPVAGIAETIWHNTGVFMRAWDWMYKTGKHRNHDWTVKVDPDTVFLPGRLQKELYRRYKPSGELKLKDYKHFMSYLDPKIPMYLVNCRQWYSFQGPLEIWSEAASEKFLRGLAVCRSSLKWEQWGEDWFVAHCMDKLGVQKREGFGLLADMYCASDYADGNTYLEEFRKKGPTCTDGRPAYHAYKTVENLTKCLDQATATLEDLSVRQ